MLLYWLFIGNINRNGMDVCNNNTKLMLIELYYANQNDLGNTMDIVEIEDKMKVNRLEQT